MSRRRCRTERATGGAEERGGRGALFAGGEGAEFAAQRVRLQAGPTCPVSPPRREDPDEECAPVERQCGQDRCRFVSCVLCARRRLHSCVVRPDVAGGWGRREGGHGAPMDCGHANWPAPAMRARRSTRASAGRFQKAAGVQVRAAEVMGDASRVAASAAWSDSPACHCAATVQAPRWAAGGAATSRDAAWAPARRVEGGPVLRAHPRRASSPSSAPAGDSPPQRPHHALADVPRVRRPCHGGPRFCRGAAGTRSGPTARPRGRCGGPRWRTPGQEHVRPRWSAGKAR